MCIYTYIYIYIIPYIYIYILSTNPDLFSGTRTFYDDCDKPGRNISVCYIILYHSML